METAPLKSFATWARRELITQVSARLAAVLAPASPERIENQRAVTMLERDITAAGGGAKGKDAVADKVAYTWFNRIIALRFMDANGYTGIGVVSPAQGQLTGQPEILADAKRGSIDPAVVSNKRTLDTIVGLLDGTRPSPDAQGEAYTLLLAEYCRYWNRSMPFMFEREGDYTELLIPANLLAADSFLTRATAALTEEVCREVEVIGWLYQFYISERKQEVFDGFKKGKKAGAAEIPAATQLFTPHWIVRYLVENTVGRLWMLNHPASRLVDRMDYYVAPVDEEADFLKISNPEELTVIDPACGSGHMLTYAFDLLYAIYEEEGYAPSEIPALILTHNLFGTEIDPRAGALAAFALTMKARDKHRAFLNKRVGPNICVIEPIEFSDEEIDVLASSADDREQARSFWQQFQSANIFGALIRPSRAQMPVLSGHLGQLDEPGDLLLAGVVERAQRVVRQATFLASEYAAIVANPPYMGSKNMTPALTEFAATNYPRSKADLMTMFMERERAFVKTGGYLGILILPSWMFVSSFEIVRRDLLGSVALNSMLHMGRGLFGVDWGSVAFVASKSRPSHNRAVYRKLFEEHVQVLSPEILEEMFLDASYHRFVVGQDLFESIPGSPFGYWLSEEVLQSFATNPSLGDVATISGSAHKTGDNARFTRRHWEVSNSRIGAGRKWLPYAKGGGQRRWYGFLDDVVDWSDSAREFYRTNSGSNLIAESLWYRRGTTFSKITPSFNTFRELPEGSVYDMGGPAFHAHPDYEDLLPLVANSRFAREVFSLLNPTINLQTGDVKKLPVPRATPERVRLSRELHAELVAISRDDWESSETALGFSVSRLLSAAGRKLSDRVSNLVLADEVAKQRTQQLEEESNRFVLTALGIPESPGLTSTPLDEVTLRTREVVSADALSQQAIAELVSYAVGCMFGRYSLDEPGLILADQGATVQDYLVNVPQPTFTPDADNVLPIVDGDWFEDDIVARFRQFLRVAFGDEHFEENLRFVEESLSVKTLREYFVTRAGRSRFYDDHVKRYKKRPIYWLFSSPKGSFNALIYMHRYTPSTVSTVLNEYLREFESKLEANLQHQERLTTGDGTPRERAAALKEAERLRKVLLELSEYEHDVLYPLASQQIAIDLDDGVKVNYPKFYPALKKITGLEAADD